MDAMVKALGSTYDAFQLMLFRSAIAMAPVAVIIWRAGGMKSGRPNRPWMQAARILVAFGSTLGFFYVFPRMPLVDAYAISFAAPLFMVALSVPMLGEPVGWRRWTAVVVGFVGVLIMLDPWGIEFHVMSVIVLGATFCYALSTVMLRLLSRHDSDVVALFWLSLATSAASLVGGIPAGVWTQPLAWVWLIVMGLLGGFAQILNTRDWRLAPPAVLAPFDYTSIVLAVLF